MLEMLTYSVSCFSHSQCIFIYSGEFVCVVYIPCAVYLSQTSILKVPMGGL